MFSGLFRNNMYMILRIFWKFKFVDFRIDKTDWKNLDEEEHKQTKTEEFEVFERILLSLS